MNVLVIINGKHKIQERAERFLEELKSEKALDLHIEETKRSGDVEAIIYRHKELAPEVIVGVGGDGTFHEILNARNRFEMKAALGFIPNGTGNDFVKMFHAIEPAEFVERLLNRTYDKIDIGHIRSNEIERFFLNISGIGLDGKVIELMEASGNDQENRLSYARAIIKAFLSFRKPTLRIKGKDFEYQGPVMMVAMCNGRVFGNGLIISPDAQLDSGMMNITLLGKVSLLDYVLNVSRLRRGQKIKHKQVYYYTSNHLEIELISGELSGEADGEILHVQSLEMRVLPAYLNVVNRSFQPA